MGRGKEADKGLGKSPQPRDPTEIKYLNMKYTLSQIAQWIMIQEYSGAPLTWLNLSTSGRSKDFHILQRLT